MINVLEHLPDTVKTMEELHRIMAHGGKLTVRVPYWNSPDMAGDPTHKVFFSESSFDFFDPTTRHGIERPYYSTARFKIARKIYFIKFFKFLKIYNLTLQRIINVFAHKLCGIIWSLELDLIALKENKK
jgi:SAM-dependent methyltransferase